LPERAAINIIIEKEFMGRVGYAHTSGSVVKSISLASIWFDHRF
jgi:hypothetical protein